MEYLLMSHHQEQDLIRFENLSFCQRIQQMENQINFIKYKQFQQQKIPPNREKKDNKSTLKQLTPLNIDQQKQKFFQSNFTINPIFVYKQNFFKDYPLHKQHLQLVLLILQDYKSTLMTKKIQNDNYLTEQQTIQMFEEYLRELNIKDVHIEFQQNCIARTRVKYTNKKIVVIIRKPIQYTKLSIIGVLNHQIGTHILRKKNNEKQLFYNRREEFGLGTQSKIIQQGLATINQVLDQEQPRLYKAALRYYSCILASELSFVELFKKLKQYIFDDNQCWNECLRVKRGIINTWISKGIYKDQIYFLGAYQLLKKRNEIDFQKLFYGRLNIQDLNKVNIIKGIKPKFMDLNYQKKLDNIAKWNYIY